MNPNERFGQLETAVSEVLIRLDLIVEELRTMRQQQEKVDEQLLKSDARQEIMIRAIQQLLTDSSATMRRIPELDDHEARLRRLEATIFPQRAA